MTPLLPTLHDFSPPLRFGVHEYPMHHLRGGTSTGLVPHARSVPDDPLLRDELLRHLMGVPQSGRRPGNRQVTGLGCSSPTSNKVSKRWRSTGMKSDSAIPIRG
ncbi:hypothetical protein [Janthinobacterium sp. RB2R34]|uniref:hypothetical protein n=1 Tax=Janthinobacterium sp. RB2R34 TaxID=3424193 RepID=UPI003F1FA223